jgi:hypothetical protein
LFNAGFGAAVPGEVKEMTTNSNAQCLSRPWSRDKNLMRALGAIYVCAARKIKAETAMTTDDPTAIF